MLRPWRSREILRQPRWARRDTPAKDAAEATVSVFYDWFTRHSKSDGCNAHLMSCTLPALDATGAAAKMATAARLESVQELRAELVQTTNMFHQSVSQARLVTRAAESGAMFLSMQTDWGCWLL
eukprot:s4263_g1.t1